MVAVPPAGYHAISQQCRLREFCLEPHVDLRCVTVNQMTQLVTVNKMVKVVVRMTSSLPKDEVVGLSPEEITIAMKNFT